MAKLWWVSCGLVLVLVCGIAAARPAVPDDSAKLEEIKALLQESLRLQRMDLHPKLFRHHKLFATCDFGPKCKVYEDLGDAHDMKRMLSADYRPTHPVDEGCVDGAFCKKREAEYQERGKKFDELLQKAQKRNEDK